VLGLQQPPAPHILNFKWNKMTIVFFMSSDSFVSFPPTSSFHFINPNKLGGKAAYRDAQKEIKP
jgi:hypothetical protein